MKKVKHSKIKKYRNIKKSENMIYQWGNTGKQKLKNTLIIL